MGYYLIAPAPPPVTVMDLMHRALVKFRREVPGDSVVETTCNPHTRTIMVQDETAVRTYSFEELLRQHEE